MSMKRFLLAAVVAIALVAGMGSAQVRLRTITQGSPQSMNDSAGAPDAAASDATSRAGLGERTANASRAAGSKFNSSLPQAPKAAEGPLNATYGKAIHAAILAKWKRPSAGKGGTRCLVTIRQLYNGVVESSAFGTPCDLDLTGRRALKDAVTKASPLPIRGYEQYWKPKFDIMFDPQQ